MTRTTLHQSVLPSLLRGTARHPLPAGLPAPTGSDPALAMLSLMGQALRLDSPAAPDTFLREPEIHDDRRLLPAHLRRPLIRVLTAKGVTPHPALALARSFHQHRLRPHPFDFPAIDSFLRAHAERLGPAAQHWADRQKPAAEARSYFDPGLIDESNWKQAPPSRRAAFLHQRRREDPAAARALLESVWASDDADTRFRLLQTLSTGLTAADEPFLRSLEKDRAPRIRGLAARLLSHLGVSAHNPALAACLERIRRGKALQLLLPANVPAEAAPRCIHQDFAGVSIAELAAAFDMDPPEAIEAAANDQLLLLALAVMATQDQRLDLLERVTAHLPDAWERLAATGMNTLGDMPGPDRHRWQTILAHPYRSNPPRDYALWHWLHVTCDLQAAPPVMAAFLDSELLANLPEPERATPLWPELAAALCPPSDRRDLRRQLEIFDPAQTITARTLLEILDEMEKP